MDLGGRSVRALIRHFHLARTLKRAFMPVTNSFSRPPHGRPLGCHRRSGCGRSICRSRPTMATRTDSHVRADVNLLSGSIERLFGGVIFRNCASFWRLPSRLSELRAGCGLTRRGTLVTLTAYKRDEAPQPVRPKRDVTWSVKDRPASSILLSGERNLEGSPNGQFPQYGVFSITRLRR